MSSDEDDFVSYGDALDPIDEDSIPRKKPITAEDQFAKDERGRRRFHGAFTGGFSAGFYNSVGSVEGWQPTQFISSRTNRNRSKDQSIFDFMDDEDTGEYGICPVSLQVKPTFDGKSDTDSSNNKKKRRILASDGTRALNTSFVREMLAPTRDTVGVMLLVKMGWKPGQGVGPRLSKKEKKRQNRQRRSDVAVKKVYGCSLPTDTRTIDYDSHASCSEEEFDGDAKEITFAPDDYQAFVVSPKQNVFGLGYQGMERKSVLSSERAELSVLTVAGKSIRGQAFGVSVFEDDDDDIYSTEDMSNYDFSLPYLGEPKSTEKKPASAPKNTNCIEGFHISTKSAISIELPIALPSIPADFQPARMKKNRWDCPVATGPQVRKIKVSSAPERSELLQAGNTNAQAKDDGNRSESIRISDIPLPEQITSTSAQNSSVSMATSGGMKPFAYDALKQNRYELFLTLKNSNADEISRIYPANMTEWEKEREKTEFEQAARLYQPLADDLACRFTRGSQKEDVHDISTPVEKSYHTDSQVLRDAVKNKKYGALTREKYRWKPDKVVCKRFNIPEPIDDGSCVSASQLVSNQSSSKKSVFEFLKMSSGNAGVNIAASVTAPSTFVAPPSTPVTAPPTPVIAPSTPVIASKSPPLPPPLPHPKLLPSDSIQNEDYVIEQPMPHKPTPHTAADEDSENEDQIEKITDKIDLFKAIFLSSSDDDDDEDENKGDYKNNRGFENANNAKSSSNVGVSPPPYDSNADTEMTTRQTDKKEIRYSPARGIFANLDLESLKCKPSYRKNDQSPTAATTITAHKETVASSEANVNVALLYGPMIPSSLLSTAANTSTSDNRRQVQLSDLSPAREIRSHHSSSSKWIEKKDKHKVKKHKKDRKKRKKSKSRKEK